MTQCVIIRDMLHILIYVSCFVASHAPYADECTSHYISYSSKAECQAKLPEYNDPSVIGVKVLGKSTNLKVGDVVNYGDAKCIAIEPKHIPEDGERIRGRNGVEVHPRGKSI